MRLGVDGTFTINFSGETTEKLSITYVRWKLLVFYLSVYQDANSKHAVDHSKCPPRCAKPFSSKDQPKKSQRLGISLVPILVPCETSCNGLCNTKKSVTSIASLRAPKEHHGALTTRSVTLLYVVVASISLASYQHRYNVTVRLSISATKQGPWEDPDFHDFLLIYPYKIYQVCWRRLFLSQYFVCIPFASMTA